MRQTLSRLAATPRLTSCLAGAVVLALAITSLGYFQLSNAVTLRLDGKPTEVRTFGNTVGDVLEAEGVTVSDRDVVVPSLDTPLDKDTEISVRFARPIDLNVDGKKSTMWTTATTVQAALVDLGVRHEGAKLSTSRGAEISRDGLDLRVATPKSVTVTIANRKPVKRNIPVLTARGALRAMKVKVDADDLVRPAGRVLKDGDKIVLTRVRIQTKSVKGEAIGFETIERKDDSMTVGETEVERDGKAGARDVTYRIVWHNGRVFKRTVLKQNVTSQPTDKIVRVGTKQEPAPAANFASGSGPFDRIAQCESGGNWSINTGNGYYGGLQFSLSTWRAYGGTGYPHEQSREQQIAVAQRLVAAQGGYGAWPHCGKLA